MICFLEMPAAPTAHKWHPNYLFSHVLIVGEQCHLKPRQGMFAFVAARSGDTWMFGVPYGR
jgi:hypothetical protein